MGILPQALLCSFSNKYWHAYSSSSLILWLQQLMPSWVFFLKPYFAASIMDTAMGILSSLSLILQLQQWIPSWVFILSQTLFGSSSPCLSCICNLSCHKRTGEEGLHKATFLLYTHHWSGAAEVSEKLMKSVGACQSSSSQLLVMNVKFTSDNLWATLIRLCLLHSFVVFTFKSFVIVVKISLQFHRYEIDNLNFFLKKNNPSWKSVLDTMLQSILCYYSTHILPFFCIAASRWLLVEQKQSDFHWWIGSRDCNHVDVAIDNSDCNITSWWFNNTQIKHWLLVNANATKQMVHGETSSGSITLINSFNKANIQLYLNDLKHI